MSGEMRQFQSSTPPPNTKAALLSSYQPLSGRFDEIHSGAWKSLFGELNPLGSDGIKSAWKRGQELLHENGIAYNLLSDDPSGDRRWALDPIPLALDETEWETLSQAAIQRARLWDSILRDCYGPRTLLEKGLIPPQLLYSQPNYQHSLRYLCDEETPLLSLYAVDVARGPDGNWTVVADRTESPNGAGFALENRIVLNNVFPGATKRLHLLRLASYFQKLRDSLFDRVPAAIESPHVVMLSPGTGDPTYFEDAYLSRYLGISLAIGEELTVRNDRLYLKTVGGLRPVHVLIRRVAENEADPLESASHGSHGIPGLFQAMRAGSVVVINPPGTGIAEAPAFLPFLPSIARELLGEDLLLPSIETQWSGSREGATLTPSTPPSVIKSAFTRNLFPPRLSRDLSAVEIRQLNEEMSSQPGQHVIQQEMPFSCAPSWNGDGFEARPVAIRLMLFSDGKDYHVMPGGLVRSAASSDTLPGLSLHENSCSKDLWVISSNPKPAISVSNLPSRLTIRRGQEFLSSRAADNMLWIGRYSERAESASRVLLEIVQSLISESDETIPPGMPALLHTLESIDYLSPQVLQTIQRASDREQIFQALIPLFHSMPGDPSTGLDTLPANLNRLRNLASLSRERLSNETWRIICLLDDMGRANRPVSLPGFRSILQHSILLHSAFNGTSRENLTRSQGWHFLNIGRKLERATWLVTMVDHALSSYPAISSSALDSILSVIDCTLTYRYRYQGAPQILPALDLILFDPHNPRGLIYQLADLNRDFNELPAPSRQMLQRKPHRTVLKALHYLQTELLETGDSEAEAAAVKELREFTSKLREDLPDVAEQLGWEFFTHVTFTRS